jgi:hypothetical protein
VNSVTLVASTHVGPAYFCPRNVAQQTSDFAHVVQSSQWVHEVPKQASPDAQQNVPVGAPGGRHADASRSAIDPSRVVVDPSDEAPAS